MFSRYDIQEIRLLPLDKEVEFPTLNEVRDYLNHDLATNHDGKYWYHERGINLEHTDALVLFQYDAQVVGYGVFKTRVKTKPEMEMVHGHSVVYHGYNEFYPNSIRLLATPITAPQMAGIDPSFRRFCRSMKKIDVKYLPDICNLLH